MKKSILFYACLCVTAIFLSVILIYSNVQKTHTFKLSDSEGIIKSEQIQPLFGTVKVSGDSDTDVIFTDVETGKQYVIGYITHGLAGKIKLEKGKWYQVKGRGILTVSPVNIRTQ